MDKNILLHEDTTIKCDICFDECGGKELKVPLLLSSKKKMISLDVKLCEKCYNIGKTLTMALGDDYYSGLDYLDDYIQKMKN